MKMRWLGLCTLFTIATASAASGALDYSNVNGTQYPNAFGAARLLDDIILANSNVDINAIEFGYFNFSGSPVGGKAVVKFWDVVDANAIDDETVNSVLLGTAEFTISVGANASAVTGLLPLPSLVRVLDDSVGVEIGFFDAFNSQINVGALLADGNPTIGVSSTSYWSDDLNQDGTFQGGERVDQITPPGDPIGNFYLQLQTQPVPEPATASLLALGAASLLSRRRTR